jgi:hypothetical protein
MILVMMMMMMMIIIIIITIIMQGVSGKVLQWYSKCYCVVSVTKTFILKGL